MFAIAHLLAHGFFKAGLFLGAGSVMHGMDDEVNMRRYGALRKFLPITFVTFGLGYLAIIGIPPFSGFFTKDSIIDAAWDKGGTSGWILAACAIIGAGITAFYMTRVMLMTCFGRALGGDGVIGGPGTRPTPRPTHARTRTSRRGSMTVPMILLAIGSVARGLVPHRQLRGSPTSSRRWSACRRTQHGIWTLAGHHRPGPRRVRRRDRLGHVRAGAGAGRRAARLGADPRGRARTCTATRSTSPC